MPPCDHHAFDTFVAVEQTDVGHLARIEIRCRECRQPMRFVGLEPGLSHRVPSCSADGTEVRLPFAAAHDDAERMRCPECERLLFGANGGDGPELDRQVAIIEIECGPEHVVHYADGVALVVGPSGVRVLHRHDDAE